MIDMDNVDTDTREALEQAVAENPEEVVTFIEHLGLVNDLLDTTDLAASALDDDMVVSLARTGTSLGEIADATTDSDTVAALSALLSAIGEAGNEPSERVGALGLLREMRDPDVQRGLGFLIAVARMTGRELERREKST